MLISCPLNLRNIEKYTESPIAPSKKSQHNSVAGPFTVKLLPSIFSKMQALMLPALQNLNKVVTLLGCLGSTKTFRFSEPQIQQICFPKHIYMKIPHYILYYSSNNEQVYTNISSFDKQKFIKCSMLDLQLECKNMMNNKGSISDRHCDKTRVELLFRHSFQFRFVYAWYCQRRSFIMSYPNINY